MPEQSSETPVTADGLQLPDNMPAVYFQSWGAKNIRVGDVKCHSVSDLGKQQVLVQVRVVALNPVDVKTLDGQKMNPLIRNPSRSVKAILGYDCAGDVVAVGTDVTGVKVGDAVYGFSRHGGLAPYTIMWADLLAKIPEGVSYAEAAGMLTAGITAYQALKIAKKNGALDSFFVTAGAGGVGHMALQLAKRHFNVKTVATTASAAKEAFVREMGADVVIDYRTDDFVSKLKGTPYDAALDSTKEERKVRKILRSDGLAVSLLAIPDGDIAKACTDALHMPVPFFVPPLLSAVTSLGNSFCHAKVKGIILVPTTEELDEFAEVFVTSKLKVVVDRVYPLEKSPEAFDHVRGGRTLGKVLIEVTPGSTSGVVQVNPL